ncbi:MAG: hypothetical protein Q8N93_04635, partial [Bacillota bacterium]|nr:hypothetical protein [Bacillota bacterium]
GEYLELYVATADGPYVFEIEKEYDGDLGIEFETPFPGLKKCGNRCLFCFVDPMPRECDRRSMSRMTTTGSPFGMGISLL